VAACFVVITKISLPFEKAALNHIIANIMLFKLRQQVDVAQLL